MKKQKRFRCLSRSIRALFLEDSCLSCGRTLKFHEEALCSSCLRRWKKRAFLRKYPRGYYVFLYQEDVREALHAYKFEGARGFGKIFAQLIKKAFWECYALEEIDLVIPVPLHPKKREKRGFNQTEDVLEYLGVTYENMQRQRATKALFAYHTKEERAKILEAAFFCPLDVDGKNILLFDDIVTTGATMEEMKAAIFSAGRPNKIVVFSISLAERVKIEQKSVEN